jgi:deoxyribonuclease V
MERDEIAKKYGIDLAKLEKEQEKFAKELVLKDNMDFKLAERFGAVNSIFVKNKIISSIIVCDKNLEVLDRAYSCEKVSFPYIPGFRAYRELPAMVNAFEKLTEKPEVIFVSGQGVTHPRLGLASHFSLSIGIPCIGIGESVRECEIKEGTIFRNDKKVGKLLTTKKESNPLYVSPGNLISVDSAYSLAEQFIKLPHKLPEPLQMAHKYAREVKDEITVSN